METWKYILLTVVGFLGMELFSWFFHRYIMHGPLWFIHKTHHQKSKYWLEFNDIFSLFFASIAIVLIWVGLSFGNYSSLFLGIGITFYGIVYFIVHDILIHKRINNKGKNFANYLSALKKAHQDHHKIKKKQPSESFGLLIVKRKYFFKTNL